MKFTAGMTSQPERSAWSTSASSSKPRTAVAYAMTIVYSTQPREAVLLIGNDDTARIWNNGKQVFLSNTYSPPDSRAVFMTLEPGRNTILAKVTNERVTAQLESALRNDAGGCRPRLCRGQKVERSRR